MGLVGIVLAAQLQAQTVRIQTDGVYTYASQPTMPTPSVPTQDNEDSRSYFLRGRTQTYRKGRESKDRTMPPWDPLPFMPEPETSVIPYNRKAMQRKRRQSNSLQKYG